MEFSGSIDKDLILYIPYPTSKYVGICMHWFILYVKRSQLTKWLYFHQGTFHLGVWGVGLFLELKYNNGPLGYFPVSPECLVSLFNSLNRITYAFDIYSETVNKNRTKNWTSLNFFLQLHHLTIESKYHRNRSYSTNWTIMK